LAAGGQVELVFDRTIPRLPEAKPAKRSMDANRATQEELNPLCVIVFAAKTFIASWLIQFKWEVVTI